MTTEWELDALRLRVEQAQAALREAEAEAAPAAAARLPLGDLRTRIYDAAEAAHTAQQDLRAAEENAAQAVIGDDSPWIVTASLPSIYTGPARTLLTLVVDQVNAQLLSEGYQATVTVEKTKEPEPDMPPNTPTVESVDLDVVVMSRARYDELLAAEKAKPNPLFSPEAVRLLTGRRPDDVPPVMQYPKQVVAPYTLDALLAMQNSLGGSIAPVDARYADLEERFKHLRKQYEKLRAEDAANRLDLTATRIERTRAKEKHRKATAIIADQKRQIDKAEEHATQLRALAKEADEQRVRAESAYAKVATVELVDTHDPSLLGVTIRHGDQIATGVVTGIAFTQPPHAYVSDITGHMYVGATGRRTKLIADASNVTVLS